MEGMAEGTNDEIKAKDKVALGKEERDNLVVCGTNILKNVGDAVLKSIVGLLQDLERNPGMQEGLKSFENNGWAFIRRTQKRNYDSDSRSTPTSFLMMDLDQINLHLKSRLDEYSINDLGWVHIRKTLKPQRQSLDYDGELVLHTLTSSSCLRELDMDQEKLNSEGRLNYETHPLDNELILKKIFEYFPVSDLKNCRLVSKNWRDVSLSLWRKKAVLQTERLFEDYDDSDDEDVPYYDEDGHVRGTKERFIKNGSKFMDFPFHRYEIDSRRANFKNPPLSERKLFILDFFSSSIQHLALHCDDLYILYMLLTELPELRVLHLELQCRNLFEQCKPMICIGGKCSFGDLQLRIPKLCKLDLEIGVPHSFHDPGINDNVSLPLPWKKIFQNAPALKSLGLCSVSDSIVTEIIRSLWEIRLEGGFSTLSLEELDIGIPLPYFRNRLPVSDDVARIIVCRFPIQTLRINVYRGDNPSTFSNLLEALAETLEFLKCDDISHDLNERELPSTPYFPSKVKLPKLKEIVLGGDCVRMFHLLCSLDVPHLENLTIGEYTGYPFRHITETQKEGTHRNILRFILKSEEFMGSYILPNLKKFSYCEPWNFGAKELEILAKAMPNLTDLCIPLRENTFPNVYKLWPALQSLHVVANELTYQLIDDYTITGIPFENYCDEVLGCRGPNITDLKCLRKFIMETRLEGERNLLRLPRGWITDLSAVYGFLQLPELQILKIESLCKFSPKVMLALENHISEMKICPPDLFCDDGSGDSSVSVAT